MLRGWMALLPGLVLLLGASWAQGGFDARDYERQQYKDGPEQWLKESDAVVAATVVVRKETTTETKADKGGAPSAGRVDGELVVNERLMEERKAPDTVALGAVKRPGSGGEMPTALEEAVYQPGENGKRMILAFLRLEDGGWVVRRSMAIGGPADPMIAGVRAIIELEKEKREHELLEGIKEGLRNGQSLVLRQYAARKLVAMDWITPADRIWFITAVYRQGMEKEGEGREFSKWCLGLLLFCAAEGGQELGGMAPMAHRGLSPSDIKLLATPALEGALSILKTSRDGETIEKCFGELKHMKDWTAPQEALRTKILDALNAMPGEAPRIEGRPVMDEKTYREGRAGLIKAYGGA